MSFRPASLLQLGGGLSSRKNDSHKFSAATGTAKGSPKKPGLRTGVACIRQLSRNHPTGARRVKEQPRTGSPERHVPRHVPERLLRNMVSKNTKRQKWANRKCIFFAATSAAGLSAPKSSSAPQGRFFQIWVLSMGKNGIAPWYWLTECQPPKRANPGPHSGSHIFPYGYTATQ